MGAGRIWTSKIIQLGRHVIMSYILFKIIWRSRPSSRVCVVILYRAPPYVIGHENLLKLIQFWYSSLATWVRSKTLRENWCPLQRRVRERRKAMFRSFGWSSRAPVCMISLSISWQHWHSARENKVLVVALGLLPTHCGCYESTFLPSDHPVSTHHHHKGAESA